MSRSSMIRAKRWLRIARALAGLVLMTLASAGSLATAEPDAPEQPIARLGDETITLSDVQPDIAFQVYRRHVDIYALLETATKQLVERRLVEREAERRDMTVDELLNAVQGEAKPPTEAEVDAYLADHPEAGSEPNARERIAYYLTEKRRIQARLDLVDTLRSKSGFAFLLDPPAQPRTRVPIEGAPASGPEDAPITLVHFASFTSPQAVRSVAYLRNLDREFPDRIRWVHRSLPIERDELGLAAAQLAACAAATGKFWVVHDRLFALEARVTQADLERIASDAGISLVRPGDTACLDAVKRDVDTAARIGIDEGPIVFVNGRYFSPTFPFENLHALVREELGIEPAAAARKLMDR